MDAFFHAADSLINSLGYKRRKRRERFRNVQKHQSDNNGAFFGCLGTRIFHVFANAPYIPVRNILDYKVLEQTRRRNNFILFKFFRNLAQNCVPLCEKPFIYYQFRRLLGSEASKWKLRFPKSTSRPGYARTFIFHWFACFGALQFEPRFR